MTYGQLAEMVNSARSSGPTTTVPQGYQARSLAQVTADMIAWQESGYSTDGMSLPPVFAVVRLIASTIDQLQLTVSGGPVPLWLRSPRRFGSALDQGDLIQWVVTSMALNGAGYLKATYNGSWKLQALHPESVQPMPSTSGVVEPRYQVDGRELPAVPVTRNEWREGAEYLLAIPYLVTPQHPHGASPLTVCRESVLGYFAVERQASRLLDNGTYSGGRLESDQELTELTAKRYQGTWIENRREGKLPVLGSGLRYINDLISPKDAQWLESRAFNAQQIAAMFGVPVDYIGLTLVGGSSSLSYSNSADNDRRFRRNALEPFTTQIADALSQLLPPGRNEDEAQEVVFDYTRWEASGADPADAIPTDPGR